MFPTIFLDEIPEYEPRELIDPNEKWIKHVHCEGARFHVFGYLGVLDKHGVVSCKIRCSEPDCIYNKPELARGGK
jgi:hypothetical protein